eukprot:jgi/Chlat1/2385/Chrsp17S02646
MLTSTEIIDALFAEISEAGGAPLGARELSEAHLSKLLFLFGTNGKKLHQALRIIDSKAVECVKGEPSGRSVFKASEKRGCW